jgi:sec-independent protein translocase protein TatC
MPRDIDDTPMPLGQHLDELRRRVMLALVGVLPVFVAGLYFGPRILDFVIRPLEAALREQDVYEGSMQATSVLEGFMTYLKIAALLAVVVGAPWILYQLWRFVAPGLYAREKRFVYLLAPMSVVLSASGLAFMYYLMLPFALFFFVHFNATLLQRPPTPRVDPPEGLVLPTLPALKGDPKDPSPGQMWLNTDRGALRIAVAPAVHPKFNVESLLGLGKAAAPATEPPPAATPPNGADASTSAEHAPVRVLSLPLHSDSFVAQHYKLAEYVNLVLTFAMVFAVVFQTPIVVLLLGWAGILEPAAMRRYRKHIILVCAVVAGIVTPPDPISMLSMGVPMYLLFELGMLLLRVFPARRVAEGPFVRAKRHDGP